MRLREIGTVMAVAVASFGSISVVTEQTRAQGVGGVRVSQNVSAAPQRSDIQLRPFQATAASVSVEAAVSVAMGVWGLTMEQIDPNTGAIPAVISKKLDPVHQNQRAWIVVADVAVPAPQSGIVFHKLGIVVDAKTGKYLYTYTANPEYSRLYR